MTTTVDHLAAQLDLDPGDIRTVLGWHNIHDDDLLDRDVALLRATLDPDGERSLHLDEPAPACPRCLREYGPGLVLHGWRPCRCGGHSTSYCRSDVGDGCGHTHLQPPRDADCGHDQPRTWAR